MKGIAIAIGINLHQVKVNGSHIANIADMKDRANKIQKDTSTEKRETHLAKFPKCVSTGEFN